MILQILTDVTQARELYDKQLFDGLIGPAVMLVITRATLYTFDVRRTCTSGRTETAGALLYGANDLSGCEEFSSVPVSNGTFPGPACHYVTYLSITNVTAGSSSAASSKALIWAFMLRKEDITLPETLFDPIRDAYNATLGNASRYVVTCDVAYPPVTLTINGSHQLTIDYWNMVYRLNGVCYLRATTYLLPDVDDGCGMYYIGIPLFHQYCLAFDLRDGTNKPPLKIPQKRNVNASVCTYVPVTTTTTEPGPPTGLSAGSIAAIGVACLVALCSVIAVVFFICRHRDTISRFNFLLAFSEARRRSKTEGVFPSSKSRIGRFSDDKQPVIDQWMVDDDELRCAVLCCA